ncbi:MAG: type IV pilus modification PilV family protein [Gemmatimonadales bacterium]
MTNPNRGFTIVEVMVAIIVLSIGILAYIGSFANSSRLLGRGRGDTNVALVASRRLEILRNMAKIASPPCTGLAGGTATYARYNISETWTVTGSGFTRTAQVIVSRSVTSGAVPDTFTTLIACR